VGVNLPPFLFVLMGKDQLSTDKTNPFTDFACYEVKPLLHSYLEIKSIP